MKKNTQSKFFFDQYIKILLKKKINKKQFNKYSDEVFNLIDYLKTTKPTVIKSEYFGDIFVPNFDNGIKKNFYDLFAFHELSLFTKYLKLRKKFSFALDVGANLGLHTIILSRLGYKVKSFEADPNTFKKLKNNLKMNSCKNYKLYNFAISDFNGTSKFYQVKNNLTANTLESSSKKIYGKYKIINVKVKKLNKYIPQENCLIKLDVEGAEFNILKTLKYSNKLKKKIFFEVNDNVSAKKIFDFIKLYKLKCLAELNGWKEIKKLRQMPTSWKQGSVLLDK